MIKIYKNGVDTMWSFACGAFAFYTLITGAMTFIG